MLNFKKVIVKKSLIEGDGVFALRNLRKGEVAFIAKGELVNFNVKHKDDSKVGPNWLGIGDSVWLDPREGNPLTFLNHSCDPNLGLKGKVSFVARRSIKKGEELTFDYSIAEADKHWKLPMKCKCGSKYCRRVIRSVQFLPEPTFKLYKEQMPKYFRRVYTTSTQRE